MLFHVLLGCAQPVLVKREQGEKNTQHTQFLQTQSPRQIYYTYCDVIAGS